MEELETVVGKFSKTIFYNSTNNYTVCSFKPYDNESKELTVIGYLPALPVNELYKLSGHYVEHKKYGVQFQIASYSRVEPSNTESLIQYFSSAYFKGIGKKMAAMIVDVLGETAIKQIKENPECLDGIKKLTPEKKETLIAGVNRELDPQETALNFFTFHGLSLKQSMKVQAVYGNKAVEKLTNNPYLMAEDIMGIGFKTCDGLAQTLGIELNDPRRLQAACVSLIMAQCMHTGNSFVRFEELEKVMNKELDGLEYDLNTILNDLQMARRIVIDDGLIYHISQYDSEQNIASYFASFPITQLDIVEEEVMNKIISNLQKEIVIDYDAKQLEAIKVLGQNDKAIITGGPGTGKTTVVKAMVAICKDLYPNAVVSLCAPTGRAAKRLSELTGSDALTIHSLLRWDLETNTFGKNADEPLLVDILIIDEFSMVDQALFANLCKAARFVKKIILIGDEDQLPSVAPGCLLKDFIDSGIFPVIRLDRIFRQKEGSGIVSLAHQIKNDNCTDVENNEDVRFIECSSYEVRNNVRALVNKAIEHGYLLNQIQVLSPMYNGIAGIDALNHSLQQACNPPAQDKRELRIGSRIYRENDKILQLKNQPDDNVYNGDIGILVEIALGYENDNGLPSIIVDFDGVIVEYTPDNFSNITHAYCISVHKSQGSEYPIVIMPITKEYRIMLQKRLLYTGISRAGKSLVLLGDKQAFLLGIKAQDLYQRETTLLKMFARNKLI